MTQIVSFIRQSTKLLLFHLDIGIYSFEILSKLYYFPFHDQRLKEIYGYQYKREGEKERDDDDDAYCFEKFHLKEFWLIT